MTKLIALLATLLLSLACAPVSESDPYSVETPPGATGGAVVATGGAESTGGDMATGGAPEPATGGAVSTGGTISTGGTVSTGGEPAATGGQPDATGGVAATGGAPPVTPIWSRRVIVSQPAAPWDAYAAGISVEVSDLLSSSACHFTTDVHAGTFTQSWAAPQAPMLGSDHLCLMHEPRITVHETFSPGSYTDASVNTAPEHAGAATPWPAGLVVTVESLTLAPLSYSVLVEYF